MPLAVKWLWIHDGRGCSTAVAANEDGIDDDDDGGPERRQSIRSKDAAAADDDDDSEVAPSENEEDSSRPQLGTTASSDMVRNGTERR